MLNLVLQIILSAAFIQLFRYSQHLGARSMAIGAVNYAAATMVSLTLWLWHSGTMSDWRIILLGLVNGVLYWTHLVMILRCLQLAGVGLTTAVTNCSSVVAVITSWAIWGDTVSTMQWAAVALTPGAMFMMRRSGAVTKISLRADLWLLMSMVTAGVILSIHKAAEVIGNEQSTPSYNVCLFAAAMAASLIHTMAMRQPPRPVEWRMGALIGAINAGVLLLLLRGLGEMDATTYYTISATMVVAINVVSSIFLWGERLRARQVVGVVAAMLIVVLVRMNGG